MFFVIGSGPSGVAAAFALVEKGYPVTMLDAGIELPDRNRELLSKARSWNPLHIKLLKHKLNRKNPLKLSYNSNFYYSEVDHYFDIQSHPKVHVVSSFAKGGLSNVWGGVLQKYNEEDLLDWPISLKGLEPYYDKVLKFLPCSLSQSSEQARSLMDHWGVHSKILKKEGIDVIVPHLAIKGGACRYCGNCQHGCPGEFIYNAAHTLNQLLKYSNFQYKNNVIVNEIQEFDNQILINAKHRLTSEIVNFEGSRVFVACGPLMSSLLYLKSAKLPRTLTFKDSTHFMLPHLMRNRIKDVTKESLHTLCQSLLILQNRTISDNKLALQLYTYMDYFQDKLKWLPKTVLDRFIVFQGFLHSNDSHGFQLKYSKQKICLKPLINRKVDLTLHKLSKFFALNAHPLGLFSLKWLNQMSKIGKSFHYGCSLPMSANPKELETDRLGRPNGYERWHVVDAAIFPTVPAGPITLTVMANAYRIANLTL